MQPAVFSTPPKLKLKREATVDDMELEERQIKTKQKKVKTLSGVYRTTVRRVADSKVEEPMQTE